MATFQIVLTDNYATSGNYTKHILDTYDVESISLNFSIADIRDISVRKGAFSKTITLPGTASNNKTLTHIFEINNITNFNPAKKANCVINVDYVTVITGFLQLVSIKYIDSGQIEYEAVVYGEMLDLVKEVGDSLLEDLDFSELAHTVNLATVTDSWTGDSNTHGYIYPVIDYGYGWQKSNLTGSLPIVPNSNIYPCVYVKRITDKIFENAGISYTSEFFESDFYKRLFIPNSSIDASTAIIKAVKTSTQSFSSGIINFEDDSVGGFDTVSKWYSATLPGSLGSSYVFETNTQDVFNFKITLFGTITNVSNYNVNLVLRAYNSALNINYRALIIPLTELPATFYISYKPFHTGLKHYFALESTGSGTTEITANSMVEIFDASEQTNLTYTLPKNVKQMDFLSSIFKMFNLYLEPSKDNPTHFTIAPFDDYYDAGSIKDWSAKLDKNSNYEVNILSELTAKKFVFSYKEDKDYLNSSYKDNTNTIYGSYDHDIDNDFTQGEVKIEPMFSATPIAPVNGYNNVVIPKIFKQEKDGSFGAVEFKPRILINSGAVPISGGTMIIDVGGTQTHVTNYPYCAPYEIPSIVQKANANCYSLNFGNIKPQHNLDVGEIAKNLFDEYYSKNITSIASPQARMLTAKFLLTALDIYNLKFNDKIFLYFENSPTYWRINAIKNFEVTSTQLTTVELVKIEDLTVPIKAKTYPKIQNETGTQNGGGDIFKVAIGNNKVDSNYTSVTGTLNVIALGSEYTSVTGNSNYVDEDATHNSVVGNDNSIGNASTHNHITGNNNIIGVNCVNVTISGNNNTIADNTTNVTVVGDNFTVTVSDKSYYTNLESTEVNAETVSATSSFTLPRLTTVERTALIGVTGMLVYDTDLNTYYSYKTEGWVALL